jgi:formylglycine-generating enzyme
VNWWEAYAFCIWDGGFLPSEAEWEYAAAGGSQQREYPWGTAAPGTGSQYAIYDCYYPSGSACGVNSVTNIAPVGTATLGAGLWGQLDLVGEVWEWNLDWNGAFVDPCQDCAYLSSTFGRVIQGGEADAYEFLSPSLRDSLTPANRYDYNDVYVGFRCARSP